MKLYLSYTGLSNLTSTKIPQQQKLDSNQINLSRVENANASATINASLSFLLLIWTKYIHAYYILNILQT